MNPLSLPDLNELIHLIDDKEGSKDRLILIRRRLVTMAIEVNGGIDD